MKNLFYLIFICVSISCSLNNNEKEAEKQKPNVLFLIVDDLRNDLGVYGADHMHTPNIDQLGAEGVVFNRSYCNVPVCGASRASLFTGLMPTKDRFKTYFSSIDVDTPGAMTIPALFRASGYQTFAFGSKVFHHGDDALYSWSEKPWKPTFKHNKGWADYYTDETIATVDSGKRGPAFECAEGSDTIYGDGKTAAYVAQKLRSLKDQEEPFFMAVGFVKPHLPFNAPQKYWDLYDRESIELAPNAYFPKDVPQKALHNWGELRFGYGNIPNEGALSDDLARELKHGYQACVSYADANVGVVLDALQAAGLDKNTIVVLIGDHGWHLGEHTLWCKHCNFDRVLRTPMLIKAPGMTKNAKTEALAEFIDIYPTLCDLAGIDVPNFVDGKSLVPVLKDPKTTVHDAVFSRYHQGESVITDRFVYTEWGRGKNQQNMLYDHQEDPDENVNVVSQKQYQSVVARMQQQLDHRYTPQKTKK